MSTAAEPAADYLAPTGVLRRRVAAGVEFCEIQRAPNLHLRRHRHERSTLSLLIAGDGREIVGGVEHRCRWPGVLYRPAGVAHENRYGSQGARSFIAIVAAEAAERELPSSPFVRDGLLAVLAMGCYEAFRRDDPLLELHSEELIAHLCERRAAPPRSRREPDWLRHVDERILGIVRPPSLAELAAAAGVHPVYLARAFRRHRGGTIGEAVRRQRMEAACRLLLTGDLTLAEVAQAAGFADQAHLSREVKAATRRSPARLRRLWTNLQ